MEDNIFMIIITGEFIIGMLGNACIGLVNSIDWIKKKKISSIDYILISLAISKVGLLCVMILIGTKMVLYPDFLKKDKLQAVINIFCIFTNYLSIWFATCLNRRIYRVIHWILLGCLALSSLISLILAMSPNYDCEFRNIAKHKGNCTEMLSQMKLNVTGCGDLSTEVGVMKTVTSFLFLLFVYYGASLLVTFSYLMKESKLAVMFEEIIATLYPSGHSLILVIGNNKLRRHLSGC
ncbi:unnamed protein product [Nyctereutes procyonoides]|uniref:Taste receptor type 2 member 8 n=1 Tax=Nyctereutes procyonoides TaxID=34880 RepID=A0A811YXW9_NYCPR|nr:unnamed protein product [Nyctereutes procyonoides]